MTIKPKTGANWLQCKGTAASCGGSRKEITFTDYLLYSVSKL